MKEEKPVFRIDHSKGAASLIDYDVLITGNNLAYADGALGISSVVLVSTTERAAAVRYRALRQPAGAAPRPRPPWLGHQGRAAGHALAPALGPQPEHRSLSGRRDPGQPPADSSTRAHRIPEDAYLPWGILEQLQRHRVTELRGPTELGPGLSAFPAPGHTPGLYALALETAARSRVVLASDAIKYPKEVMIGVGDLVLNTVEASRASIAAILAQADRIVPGHFVEMRKQGDAWTWDQPAPFDLRFGERPRPDPFLKR